MRLEGRFLKDSGLTFAGRVASRALYLLQAPPLARWLGPELNGRYAFAFSSTTRPPASPNWTRRRSAQTARQPENAAPPLAHALRIHVVLSPARPAGHARRLSAAAAGFGRVHGPQPPGPRAELDARRALGRFDLQALSETMFYGLQLLGSLAAVQCGFGLVGTAWPARACPSHRWA